MGSAHSELFKNKCYMMASDGIETSIMTEVDINKKQGFEFQLQCQNKVLASKVKLIDRSLKLY